MKKSSTIIFVLSLVVCSCSVSRHLQEGEYFLSSNKIVIDGKEKIKSSSLSPYLRQQLPNTIFPSTSPWLNVYFWADSSDKGLNPLLRKIGTQPVIFSPILMQNSADNIASRLATLGYYSAQVTPEVELKNGIANVVYYVKPGKRLKIDEIRYELCPSEELAKDFYADSLHFSVKKGDYLSEVALEDESIRGSKYFRQKGYYDINKNHYSFEADTLGNRNILYYRLNNYTRNETAASAAPLKKYHFRKLSIQHPEDIRFRADLLSQLNTIHPGDLYNEENVNLTYYRFSNLSVFNSVNVEINPADSALLDCNIRLDGSDLYGFKLNADFSTNSSGLLGTSPQLSFYHKNLFNGGEHLNINLSGNWQFMPGNDARASEYGISASLSMLSSIGLSNKKMSRNIPRAEIKTSFNYMNRPEFRRSVFGLSYGYSSQFNSNFFYQIFPIQLNIVKMHEYRDMKFIETLFKNAYLMGAFIDQVDMGVGAMLYYTTNPDIVPKTAYSSIRFSTDIAGNVLSLFNKAMPIGDSDSRLFMGLPYSQYVRGELSTAKVFRFGRDDSQALALRFNVGVVKAYGNSIAVMFDKQFFCGGANSMRGWQARSLGPGSEMSIDYRFEIPSQTGDLKLEADLEYRFPIVSKFEGALFAEVGNIWNMKDMKKDFLHELAADWGLGARVNLDFILLRLDVGFKVHDPGRPSGQKWLQPKAWFQKNGAAIHFGVGYPF